MKKYCVVISIVCFITACSNRTEKETQSVIQALFEKEIQKGYPIYLMEDADFNWFSKSGAAVCDEDWFKEIFNWKSDESAKFEKILSEKTSKNSAQKVNRILDFKGPRFQKRSNWYHAIGLKTC